MHQGKGHSLEVFRRDRAACAHEGISVDVGATQKKLSLWAEQERSHRFYALDHLLYHEVWLSKAPGHGRRNAGSTTAGGDGVTMRDFEEDLGGNLRTLQETLKVERFEPHPVRRTSIQELKSGGRIKMRPLGIPDICDRMVQEASGTRCEARHKGES
jgi:retron-type reverse transcriptase